jgi:hypothetical protein
MHALAGTQPAPLPCDVLLSSKHSRMHAAYERNMHPTTIRLSRIDARPEGCQNREKTLFAGKCKPDCALSLVLLGFPQLRSGK